MFAFVHEYTASKIKYHRCTGKKKIPLSKIVWFYVLIRRSNYYISRFIVNNTVIFLGFVLFNSFQNMDDMGYDRI